MNQIEKMYRDASKEPDTNKTLIQCSIHNRPIPCLSCRGAKGGRVSSPKKSAANRLKAKSAALARWRGERIKKISEA